MNLIVFLSMLIINLYNNFCKVALEKNQRREALIKFYSTKCIICRGENMPNQINASDTDGSEELM